MDCHRTLHLLCNYLEDRLSLRLNLMMRQHLGKCPSCRLVLESAQRTLAANFEADRRLETANKSQVA